MAKPRRGRPPNPVDPEAGHGAKLGAKLREMRVGADLTLEQLGELAGFTPQYISEAERAKAAATTALVGAIELALNAPGALEPLLPAALHEHEERRRERAAARRKARTDPALRCDVHSEVAGDNEDVEPTDRRGLLGAGAAAALGAPLLGVGAVPTRAGEIDPELPVHWMGLLRLLGRLDMLCGPHMLVVVRRETELIAAHRSVARGELHIALMRVEARWADLAAWLSQDTSRPRERDVWTKRAGRLAQEAEDRELVAFWRARQGEWAAMSLSASAAGLGEAALDVRGTSAQTRAWSARQAAIGHALAGNTDACERHIAAAYALLESRDATAPPWAHEFPVTYAGTRATEANCWLLLEPAKAIPRYDDALRDWPRDEVRDRGLHGARLALACAKAGERDRAEAEGRKALAIAQATDSASTFRELKRLGTALNAN